MRGDEDEEDEEDENKERGCRIYLVGMSVDRCESLDRPLVKAKGMSCEM